MKIIRTLGIGGLAASLLFGGASAANAAMYSPEGRPLVETVDAAGSGAFGEANGAVREASFRHPGAVLVMKDGSLLVADTGNHRIRQIKNGEATVFAGTEVSVLLGDDGLPAGALNDGARDVSFFQSPMGLAADGAGNVYVADKENHAVRKISSEGAVTTIAGGGVLGFADGTGDEAAFYMPSDVAVDTAGNVYVADTLNHAIRKIDPNGVVTTLNALSERTVEAYDGVVAEAGDFADGPLAEALFNEPTGLAVDGAGNLYVSDTGNQRIRYIDFAAGTVSTVAGGGTYANNALYVEGFYEDGAASDARFFSPKGLAVDAAGGVYIADSLTHSIRYLKDGQVVTVVGNGKGEHGSANGVDEAALVDYPSDVAVDAAGNLYVADTYNNKIRKIEFYELPAGWAANGRINVLYNNNAIAFDAQPEIRSDRTMVPVRAIVEAMGYDVAFEGERIVLTGEAGTITLTVGSTAAVRTANGVTASATLDAAPYVQGERTYVPIRFFAEAIGVAVDWHGETSTVILRD